MTKPELDKAAADRRSFLKLAGAGSVAGAAAVATASAAVAAPAEPSKDALYRETAHVKRYYDLAKF